MTGADRLHEEYQRRSEPMSPTAGTFHHAAAMWSIPRQQWVIDWHGREVNSYAVEPATMREVDRLNRLCKERRCFSPTHHQTEV